MNRIILSKGNFAIRETEIEDSQIILSYIKKIAAYEKMSNHVVAKLNDVEETIFKKKQAHVVLAIYKNQPIGFMLYFYTYSTFLGRANLYLEDLFIDEAYRHKGYGKLMFEALAKIALDQGCKRIDWMCLDWNQPSIDFYKSIGAKALDQWITFRLETKDIKNLIEKKA